MIGLSRELIKKLCGGVKQQFDALEARTRQLLTALLVVIVFSLAVNLLYKPQRLAVFSLQQEYYSLNNRLLEIRAKVPDVEGERLLLEKEKISLKVLQNELAQLEDSLPEQDSLPELLMSLFRKSNNGAMEFSLIKPLQTKKSADYDQLELEMRFSASYSHLVHYLRSLEQLSQFILVESVECEEEKDVVSQHLNVRLVLSSLLGERGSVDSRKRAVPAAPEIGAVTVARNPFQSEFSQIVSSGRQNEYKLSGIISKGFYPTAIINDEVYRIGDQVGKGKIMEILTDQVILKEGLESISLRLDQ